MGNNLGFFDGIQLLSLILQCENLIENREQTSQNDVHKANAAQANYILSGLYSRLDEQKEILMQILEDLEEIKERMYYHDRSNENYPVFYFRDYPRPYDVLSPLYQEED